MAAKAKMKHLALDEIKVDKRFREDFGDMEGLMESIKEKGIIQPISVSSDMQLLAGGRRYEACRRLELKTIPALIREDVDEIDAREVELIENVFRKDFEWQERAALTAEIHDLYTKKYPDWSGRKTAGLIERDKSSVNRDLQLARALEVIPELGESKTADDAFKKLKKLEEEAIVAELSRRQRERNSIDASPVGTGPLTTASGTHSTGTHVAPSIDAIVKEVYKRADASYRIGDIFHALSTMRSNGHVEFIECDPPYGVDLTEQKAGKENPNSTIHGYEEVPTDQYEAFLEKLCTELYRVAGNDCWMVFWYGPTWHHQVITNLRKAGWEVDDIPAIWCKFNGQTLQPEIRLARAYEPFFVCRKGKPVLARRGRINVFNGAGVEPANKYHPTERPQWLAQALIDTFCIPGNRIFVPFLGSGSTLRAAFKLGFSAHGYDINDQYKSRFLLAIEADTRFTAASLKSSENKESSEDAETEDDEDIPF